LSKFLCMILVAEQENFRLILELKIKCCPTDII